MPPAICNDSEDEDEILVDDGPSQRSTFSAYAAHAEAMLETFPNFDGAGDEQPASTTSSEMRRQILSAERNLVATASLSTPAVGTSTSPVLLKEKRRRTTVVGSEPVASPPKSARRTNTTNTKTYGKSNRTFQAEADSNAAFDQLRDNADAPKTSQSARFTEHSSGPNPSSGLPAGTLQQDFVNHEPNVMFKDTGSTNAFNESSQQRLIEQALHDGEKPTVASDQKVVASAERQQSSSFPWSTSADPTQSQTNKQNEVQPGAMPDAQPEDARRPGTADDTIAVAAKQSQAGTEAQRAPKETEKTPAQPADITDQAVSKSTEDGAQQSSKSHPPKSSPIVEIPRYQPSQDDSNAKAAEEPRSRKRKAQIDAEEQLNSDDKAIGLPKETYEPRPSRRRATAVGEEPIDYSVVPERAAKKRRKTAEGKASIPDRPPPDEEATTSKAKSSNVSATPKAREEEDTGTTVQKESGSQTQQQEPTPTPRKETQPSNTPSEEDLASAKKAADAMPMKPPAIPSSANKKIRRSKTTIFEDHVNRAEKSPSLSQQQASRERALSEAPNEIKPNKRKSRKPVVQDDDDEDDEEDELAKDMSEEEVVVQPKKRGRPAKQKPPPKAKSKERVLEDSEAEEDELELEVEEPPPKKPRGRPPKAQANNAAKEKEATQQAEKAVTSTNASSMTSDSATPSSPSKAALERKDANARPPSKDADTATTKDTTSASTEKPSSDKSLPSPQRTPAKPSPPTTHSPIKSSTFANYRVGLSKRSRIPSLLKSFRAPAPARR